MDNVDNKTTIDELDIDELIEETKELLEDDIDVGASKTDEETSKSKDESEKPKKKKLPILPALSVVLFIVTVFFGFLTIKEARKKPVIKTGFFVINKKINFITKEKIKQQTIKQETTVYNFKLLIAYKFASISGIKILKSVVYTKFSSKALVPLDKLYSLINNKIYKDFSELSKGKYLEDIKNYKKTLSAIIKQDTLEIIKNVIPDVDMRTVKKNFKINEFIIF